MAGYVPKEAPDPELKTWPSGIPFIIGNEGCERFSYYGMKAILFVYIVGLYMNLEGTDLDDARNTATESMHLWSAAVYALPLIGAIISDRLLGKYRTILYLSVVYCLGHLALALFEGPGFQQAMFGQVYVDPIQGMWIGLGLIALGSGGIKPCVSAHVGDQFGKGNWHMLQKVYNAFYFIINFGSAFATILIPEIRGEVVDEMINGVLVRTYTGSVGWAFGIPGILMGLATVFFWMGRKTFIHVPPTHPGKRGLLDVLSGSFLFMGILAVPIWFHDILAEHIQLENWLPFFPSADWVLTALVSIGFVIAFVLTYAARQRIEEDDGFLALTFYALRARLLGLDPGPGEAPEEGESDLREHFFYGPVARKFGNILADGPVAVWRIISVFFLVSVFWGLFHQHSSTWIAQARDMERTVDLALNTWLIMGAVGGLVVGYAFVLALQKKGKAAANFALGGLVVGLLLGYLGHHWGPYEPSASKIPAVNPFMVMILIPYTTFGLYPLMERLGLNPTPLRRMTIGMVMASAAFVAVALVQMAMESAPEGELVHVGWQMVPYFIVTLAEVMVSITGLEFAYTQAPKRMKSVIMGFWLLNVTIGDLLVVFVTRIEFASQVTFFWVFAVLMLVAGLGFGWRARTYTYRSYTQ